MRWWLLGHVAAIAWAEISLNATHLIRGNDTVDCFSPQTPWYVRELCGRASSAAVSLRASPCDACGCTTCPRTNRRALAVWGDDRLNPGQLLAGSDYAKLWAGTDQGRSLFRRSVWHTLLDGQSGPPLQTPAAGHELLLYAGYDTRKRLLGLTDNALVSVSDFNTRLYGYLSRHAQVRSLDVSSSTRAWQRLELDAGMMMAKLNTIFDCRHVTECTFALRPLTEGEVPGSNNAWITCVIRDGLKYCAMRESGAGRTVSITSPALTLQFLSPPDDTAKLYTRLLDESGAYIRYPAFLAPIYGFVYVKRMAQFIYYEESPDGNTWLPIASTMSPNMAQSWPAANIMLRTLLWEGGLGYPCSSATVCRLFVTSTHPYVRQVAVSSSSFMSNWLETVLPLAVLHAVGEDARGAGELFVLPSLSATVGSERDFEGCRNIPGCTLLPTTELEFESARLETVAGLMGVLTRRARCELLEPPEPAGLVHATSWCGYTHPCERTCYGQTGNVTHEFPQSSPHDPLVAVGPVDAFERRAPRYFMYGTRVAGAQRRLGPYFFTSVPACTGTPASGHVPELRAENCVPSDVRVGPHTLCATIMAYASTPVAPPPAAPTPAAPTPSELFDVWNLTIARPQSNPYAFPSNVCLSATEQLDFPTRLPTEFNVRRIACGAAADCRTARQQLRETLEALSQEMRTLAVLVDALMGGLGRDETVAEGATETAEWSLNALRPEPTRFFSLGTRSESALAWPDARCDESAAASEASLELRDYLLAMTSPGLVEGDVPAMQHAARAARDLVSHARAFSDMLRAPGARVFRHWPATGLVRAVRPRVKPVFRLEHVVARVCVDREWYVARPGYTFLRDDLQSLSPWLEYRPQVMSGNNAESTGEPCDVPLAEPVRQSWIVGGQRNLFDLAVVITLGGMILRSCLGGKERTREML